MLFRSAPEQLPVWGLFLQIFGLLPWQQTAPMQVGILKEAIDKAVSTKVTSIALNEQTNHKLQSLGLLTTFASISATEKQSGMEPMTSVNFYSGTDIEAICYDKLKSARRYLTQACALVRTDIERGKCNYLIKMIDRVL